MRSGAAVRFVDGPRSRGVWCADRIFRDSVPSMDRFASAQARLFAAFDRLEAAVTAHRAREARLLQDKAALEEALAGASGNRADDEATERSETGPAEATQAMTADLDRVRAENAALRAAKTQAAERLDAALDRLKMMLAS